VPVRVVKAGALDSRATIRAKTLTPDASGQSIESWTDVETVWAEKTDLRGREFFSAQAINAEIETRFRLRWRTGLTPENRLVCDGRDYEILSVAEIGRREGLELMCKARAE
jgi:SPP1 family predicted phage head-tail adaptor